MKHPRRSVVVLAEEDLQRAARRVIAYRAAHGTRRSGKRLPLPQADFARRAGVSPGCLTAFENNTRRTGVERVRRIAAACGLTLEQLIEPEPAVDALLELPDEAIVVARLYAMASTEMRIAVRDRLCLHMARRRDAAAVALVRQMKADGSWPVHIAVTPMSEPHARLLATLEARLPTFTEEQARLLVNLLDASKSSAESSLANGA